MLVNQSVLGDYSVRQAGTSQRAEAGRAGPKIYWFVIRGVNRKYKVRALNEGCLPSGVCKEIGIVEFMTHFDPEPEHYIEKTIPAIRGTIEQARTSDEKREILARLGIEIEDGIDLDQLLERLFIDARFVCFEQSKEINEYIILLRKQGKLDEAIRFCDQALELSPLDENLLFNVARVHYEKNDFARASEFVDRALQVNPGMALAGKFRDHLKKRTRKHRLELG